ncbi:NAD(P)/FAD-dependent oxidoreductase [Virgibacillus halodenitrificans]|uniref:NAD(P)/FAD-dependent oxidoreductase n=1 Tax=Virgibacillus halodenitrificans TaxID=1482 RepID=UPI0002D27587|nr:NAD(P)/FAD-dependent oxidoreductase [Virgibacillus halodenitrificans]MCG1026982.1 NAD(P)/FAD-dependent oxidoreductase [Virgibacillus halodenitrificans]MCJ0932731.1 NAD(P)/FAD-dependent oxidoreductase [Virgibacillus halodenitrificans]MEC2159029.1 NAD(P)/FAD-dependent oxidoreductase [Virgibacillus halodenitrificans]MYL46062.1 ferredoxin--NADP(+) reductase [Virgibacillus halodenitrificans]MYL56821.1 ferredoxin--NADP(+) reductase [Virgibacillus halodenitrificans]
MSEEVFDVTIIGAGPVGLFTAFYGGMRQASVKIIESLPHTGGQLTALYPEKDIYDIAGFPKVRAQELVDNLEEQANLFNPTIILEQSIEEIERMSDGSFKLISNTKEIHYSKTIIITAGNGAFQPRRLNVGECDQFEGVNLHYHVKDMNQYKGQNVALLGGGDSAVDWALMLEPIANKVTLIHRRDKFRAHEHSVEKLMSSNVDVLTPYVPTDVQTSDKIDRIVLEEVKGENKVELEVDSVLCNYGFVSTLGPIKNWGLEIEKNSIVVNSKMETNIPGIYAAGDICTYEGKVKLIATGFGEGPTAINNAKQYIDPKARIQPKHSTSMF